MVETIFCLLISIKCKFLQSVLISSVYTVPVWKRSYKMVKSTYTWKLHERTWKTSSMILFPCISQTHIIPTDVTELLCRPPRSTCHYSCVFGSKLLCSIWMELWSLQFVVIYEHWLSQLFYPTSSLGTSFSHSTTRTQPYVNVLGRGTYYVYSTCLDFIKEAVVSAQSLTILSCV